MSSSVTNSQAKGGPAIEWAARLIPGAGTAFTSGKLKHPRSSHTRLRLSERAAICEAPNQEQRLSEKVVRFLMPSLFAVQEPQARWIAPDFALITVNWLLLGACGVVLRLTLRNAGLLQLQHPPQWPSSLLAIGVINAALITLIAQAEGLYRSPASAVERRRLLAKSVFLAMLVLAIASRLRALPVGIDSIMTAALLHMAVLSGWRGLSERRIRQNAGERSTKNVLLIGAGETARRIAQYVQKHPEEGRCIIGVIDKPHSPTNGATGPRADIAILSRRGFVDEVIIAGIPDREVLTTLVSEVRRLRLDLELAPDFEAMPVAQNRGDTLAGYPLISLHKESVPKTGLRIKRAFDLISAGFAFAVLSPLFVVIALMIRLDSRGPIIYAAPRAGLKGRIFRCYKFRTMVSDADKLKAELRGQNERSGVLFKIAKDPRITRVGTWLRRYSLDELPQLWNVLKGDMSLVGPRPHPLDDVAAYDLEHFSRLDVTPGITGLWQVSARRDPSFEHSIELDREYIQGWSLGFDLHILLRTVVAVVRGSGE